MLFLYTVLSAMKTYLDLIPLVETSASVGLIVCKTPAGFPSPAQDMAVNRIDIDDGDHLIVDRSLTAKHNSIVIAEIDGDVTVKRLHKKNGVIRLKAANLTYPDIVPVPGQEWMIWGVVTHVIKDML